MCGGNEAHYKFLMDWLAHMVQRPQEKPGTCVVLKGIEGAGKTILSHVMGLMLGSSALAVSQSKHILGNFNSHLEHNILLTAEEALWAGDKAGEGVQKELITGKDITIERKGFDAYAAKSYTRLLMITNNDWCAPAGAHSRRYFVLEVKSDKANKKDYFDPLYYEIENGCAEALLDELLRRDIESNLRYAPVTNALLGQREQSLSNLERFFLEVARSAAITKRDGSVVNLEKQSTEIMASDVWDAAKLRCGNDHGLYRTLGPLLADLGVTKTRPRILKKQIPHFAFPPYAEFAANVSEHLGVPVQDTNVIEGGNDECAENVPARARPASGASASTVLH